jgi:pyruvate formate lyase activating enzyme
MAIKGFQGTSLLDYPGKISSLIFFGGCNLTCPFCHNPGLVLDPGQYPDFPLEQILGELRERRNFIDGVVVSGGEPTLAADLVPTLREIKNLGLDIKLDTNGLLPGCIENLVAENLVDYVAMDVKTAPRRYNELHTQAVKTENLLVGIRLLIEGKVPYEFRTTCVPGLVEKEDIVAIGEALRGANLWILQQFVASYALDEKYQEMESHPLSTLQDFVKTAETWAAQVSLRGV